jgi:hypothetical protein
MGGNGEMKEIGAERNTNKNNRKKPNERERNGTKR